MRKDAARLGIAVGVGLSIALAAVGISGLLAGPALRSLPPPQVRLSAPMFFNFSVSVSVLSVDRVLPLQQFSASLLRDLVVTSELESLSRGFGPGGLSFGDSGDFRLSVGDRFDVSRTDPGAWELRLAWRGTPVGNATWEIRLPTVTLAASGGSPTSWGVNVTAIDGSRPLWEFGAVLYRNGAWSDQMDPLQPGPSSFGLFAFEDRDTNGNLSPGDGFLVNAAPGNEYVLQLVWRSMNVASASWSV